MRSDLFIFITQILKPEQDSDIKKIFKLYLKDKNSQNLETSLKSKCEEKL